jgi:fatty acid desaturase
MTVRGVAEFVTEGANGPAGRPAGAHAQVPRTTGPFKRAFDRSATITDAHSPMSPTVTGRNDPDHGAARLTDLETVRKTDVISSSQVRYVDFRKTLTPRYGRVWLDIIAGYAGLALVAVAMAWLQAHAHLLFAVAAIPVAAFGFGYAFCYLQLFVHEAAHKNLLPSEPWNDRLTDLLLSGLVGMSIKDYRAVHWAHHRALGETSDTERSYFEPLTTRFVLESLAGIRVLRVLGNRRRALEDASPTGEPASRWFEWMVFLYGVGIHAGIVGSLVALGYWPVAAAWVMGVCQVFPLFFGLRQVLEHRGVDVDPATDFTRVAHGRCTRIFGDGVVDRTFGAAGFNRHLLHHWDPTVSYTRLRDVEQFLQHTSLGEPLRQARTTYFRTFQELFRR